MRKEKGWLNSFRSSEKALRRYNNLYKLLFENQLKFQISYMITILSIKNKFYDQIQKILENRKIILPKNDRSGELLLQILMKLREGFDFNIYKAKFPIFCIQEFKADLPTDDNLMNFKRKFVNYLERLNISMNEGNIIKKVVNRIYSKIKYKHDYVIPPEIIRKFQDMSLDEFKEIPDIRYFIRGSDDGKLKEFDIFTGFNKLYQRKEYQKELEKIFQQIEIKFNIKEGDF